MPGEYSITAFIEETLDEEAAARAEAPTTATPVDPRIKYPCYKSFDPFIDVERLKSLDVFMAAQIRQHMARDEDHRFYTGPYRLNPETAGRAGSRMIYLTESNMPDSYFDLDKPEVWARAEAAAEFEPLMDFIATLPFRHTGRMLIIYDDVARPGPAHRDHVDTSLCHEFIWFRTNMTKRFYMLDPKTGERDYVESYSAWFDTVNQFHGSDAHEGLSFSVRVDGVFTDAFRRRIPLPATNRASMPALWAFTGDNA
jgi:hypothetical protein